jgi:hypothetical protein
VIYNVIPGDSLAFNFAEIGIGGETIVCRECFVVGPIDGSDPDEFWDARARFISSEYGEDPIAYHETVADELERLNDVASGDEVNLWFEYELFCSVNLWFMINILQGADAKIFRVEPILLSEETKWEGFGRLSSNELKECYKRRRRLTPEDMELGCALWNSYKSRDSKKLLGLAKTAAPNFPYLKDVCTAAAEIETQPEKIVLDIVSSGTNDFADIFAEFTRSAGVYGFGDLQVRRLVERTAS